jgi:ribose transport system substrate-binding protein
MPRIALVMKSLANPFFVTMAAGARAHQSEQAARYTLLINGTRDENDLAQQVSIIDQMIAAGAQAIVFAPADSKAIVPAAARALSAGVIMVNIDNRLDPNVMRDYRATIPFIGPDDRGAAEKVGNILASQLKPGDQVAILEGIQTANNSILRRDGLLAAAKSARLNVVSVQSARWDQTQAAMLTSALLLRYPGLKGVLCANDSMALGAASAVEQAGREQSVKVTGFDNLEAIQPLIKRGLVVATADQHGGELAVFGIEYALEALAGARSLVDRMTPVDIITHAGPSGGMTVPS